MEEIKNKLLQRLSFLYKLLIQRNDMNSGYVQDSLHDIIKNAPNENSLKEIESLIENNIDALKKFHE